jgi:hypothetical protein
LLRRSLIVAVAAAVIGLPVVTAHAVPEACPAGVATATGSNPSYADISALLESAATDPDPVRDLTIPPQVLKAIAYVESQWRQYDTGGHVVISGDAVCGVGMMQVTATESPDPQRLATDIAYNVSEAARILRAKWAAQGSNPPNDTGTADDPAVVENWYYAVCLYNGCGTNRAYPNKVAETSADPFRRVLVADIKPFMPIAGFTKPDDANPGYALPQAFQARLDPSRFVFYDNATGNVTSTVLAPTHRYTDPAPVVTYGAGEYGPDGPGVTCDIACGGWRLAEGGGIAGRAHWTLSSATQGTRITWAPALPRTGTYRIWAYVPAVWTATAPLGTATYRLGAGTFAVGQAAVGPDRWAAFGDWTLAPGATVSLDDVASTTGRTLAADAIRFSAVTRLDLASSRPSVTYGQSATLTARLSYAGTATALAGRTVRLYQRRAGTSAWSYVGPFTTDADGSVATGVAPAAHTEYQARFASPSTDTTSATSPTVRVDVGTRVTARLSRTTVPRNVAMSVAAAVAPSHAGQTVLLQRHYYGAWHTVTTRTLGSASTTTFPLTNSVAGTYRYRVVKPADADHLTGWSATLTLTVT